MKGKFAVILVAFLIVGAISRDASAFDERTDLLTDAHIRKLLLLMDRDKSGTVSKNEFMKYMSRRFDELDVDHSRRLEPDEAQAMKIPIWVIRKAASSASPMQPRIRGR